MNNDLDTYFKLPSNALSLHSFRQQLLASNLANADTPGYRAKEIDFSKALQQASVKQGSLLKTHFNHLSSKGSVLDRLTYERAADQASLDGNTVNVDKELSAFSDNAIRYQISLGFLNSRIKGLMTAIQGQ